MFNGTIVKRFSFLITILLAISKLHDLWLKSGRKTIYVIYSLAGIILFMLICPLLERLTMRYPWFARFFKILPPSSYYITKSSHEVVVKPNGDAEITALRDMVFFKKPKKWELYDIFYVDKVIERKKFTYHSNDAEDVDRIWVGKNRLVIFWQPRNQQSIPMLTPYRHHFYWEASCNFDEVHNHWNIVPIVKTGRHTTMIKTIKDIEYAVSFKKPWYIRATDGKVLYKYAYNLKRTKCPQPAINNKREITLTQEYLNPRDLYICVFSYDSGCEILENSVLKI